MMVMGADPGSSRTGYSILKEENGNLILVDSGVFRPSRSASLSQKLSFIYRGFLDLFRSYPLDSLAVEGVFYSRNFKSALRLGEVRGVIILAAGEMGIPVFEYSPADVKLSVVGYGTATKEQVRYMVSQVLEEASCMSLDESDATAVALCHICRMRGVFC